MVLNEIMPDGAKRRWGALLPKLKSYTPICVPRAWLTTLDSRLRFRASALFCLHADLRVSLRKMRTRQRDSCPFQRLERHQVPAMRLHEAREKNFDLRFR
jgi:hypothetical protein